MSFWSGWFKKEGGSAPPPSSTNWKKQAQNAKAAELVCSKLYTEMERFRSKKLKVDKYLLERIHHVNNLPEIRDVRDQYDKAVSDYNKMKEKVSLLGSSLDLYKAEAEMSYDTEHEPERLTVDDVSALSEVYFQALDERTANHISSVKLDEYIKMVGNLLHAEMTTTGTSTTSTSTKGHGR